MAKNADESNFPRVSDVNGQQIDTTSDRLNMDSNPSRPTTSSAPSDTSISSRSNAITLIPNPTARRSIALPVPPNPKIPKVAPVSSISFDRISGRCFQESGPKRNAVPNCRVSINKRPKPWSARCSPTNPFSLVRMTSLDTNSS